MNTHRQTDRSRARLDHSDVQPTMAMKLARRVLACTVVLQFACSPKSLETSALAPTSAAKPTAVERPNSVPTAQPTPSSTANPNQDAGVSPDVVVIQVGNAAAEARVSQTIAVGVADIRRAWMDPKQVLVADASGNPIMSQLTDMDGDEEPDEILFQTDLGPGEVKRFSLRFGKRALPPREAYKVYGRFVRERHDDFAWENDRIARRMYGPDLEVWSREPLTSSGIDAWVKRTRRLVVNDWYLTDDYHHDRGEGADFYSVGKSRGCGGLGIWAKDALHVSRNFTRSRVLANGPLRLVFELDYAPWDVGGVRISETKRITLDAGRNFERFESTFKSSGPRHDVSVGIGIAKHKGAEVAVDSTAGWMRTWEPIANNGNFGCGIVLPPGVESTPKQTESDYLILTKAASSGRLLYYAGFGWDRSGDLADSAAWTNRVQALAREVATPTAVQLSPGTGARPWSARACASMIERDPNLLTSRWHYDSGFVLMGCQRVAQKFGDRKFSDFAKRAVDGLIGQDGTITGYRLEEYNIDNINMGKVVFSLYEESKDQAERQRYEKILRLLRSQMKSHPRTKEGGYWHKQIYPHQLWLDGAYMAAPYLAKYAKTFQEPRLFDEVANELLLLERHTRDKKSGLLYHGWDESREQRWANKATGTSPHFWGRAMGWYAMALVDVLEFMPKDHLKRGALIAVLQRLATAIASVQDAQTGVWWQVLDAAKRDKNYREASASAMFVYALTRGIKNGWLDAKKFGPVADRGYRGTLEQFVEVDARGRLDLKNVCKVAGLGGTPYRDGSYEYYTTTEIVANDPKGVGAFIVASLDRE